MDSGVYKITNIVNGKIYVGSAVSIRKRAVYHLWSLKSGRHCNSLLQRAFDKYGEDSFRFDVLEICDRASVVEREQFYINELNATDRSIGYNICPTAGSVSGRVHSEATKMKIGNANRGRKISDEGRQAMSARKKGSKLTAEHRMNIGNSNIGRVMSDEARLKISAGNKGKARTIEQRTAISIRQTGKTLKRSEAWLNKIKASAAKRNLVILDTYTGVFYVGLKEAAGGAGVSRQTILNWVRGNNIKSYNRYKEC